MYDDSSACRGWHRERIPPVTQTPHRKSSTALLIFAQSRSWTFCKEIKYLAEAETHLLDPKRLREPKGLKEGASASADVLIWPPAASRRATPSKILANCWAPAFWTFRSMISSSRASS